jgi:ATP-dependent RNA helicase DDX27
MPVSKFGISALVRTIESDDEVEDFDSGNMSDESDSEQQPQPKGKPTKQSAVETLERQHAAGQKHFFSEIEQSKADEDLEKESVLSIKNASLRQRIQNRAELIKARAEEAKNSIVDDDEIAKQVNLELMKKRNAKYGIDSDDSDSDSDDEFSRPPVDSDEEEEEKREAARMISERQAKAHADFQHMTAAAQAIADDEDDVKWGGIEDNDDDIEDALNQDVFATQTSVTTSDMSGENALTIVPSNMDFTDLRLSRQVIQGIKHMNFSKPTPIQSAAIPLALAGQDILANAVTGSGKTAAFVLPMIERLLHQTYRTHLIRAVIVTPTRELAEQIYKVVMGLAKYTDIRACCIVGGFSLQLQEVELRAGPDIVVCTPGRLIDHLANSKSVDLDSLEMLVLDEADRLLEMGFIDEVREIVNSCPRSRQTMLFSATLNNNVKDLIHLSLKDPKRISVDKSSSIVDTLTQEFVRLRNNSTLVREAIVLALCKRTFTSRTIVFCRTKLDAHRLLVLFGLCGLRAAELHGNLTQTQRLDALQMFKDSKVDFLICTDLASRGIDIKGVQTVINLHMPRELAQYVHRVGRTARAGTKGRSVSLVCEDERRLLRDIMKAARNVVKKREVPPEIVEKYTQKVSSLMSEVDVILNEEKAERELRIAERDLNKAENLIKHSAEIAARPARQWFQTNKEKEDARSQAALVSSQTITELKRLKKSSMEQEAEIKALEATVKKADDDDPLRGLSRAKKRRKMFSMETKKFAEETRVQLADNAAKEDAGEVGMSEKEKIQAKKTLSMLLHPERAAKAVKRKERREADAVKFDDNDGAGPQAFANAVRAERNQFFKDKARNFAQDTRGKKKASSLSENRRYMDKNSSEYLTGTELSGRGRYKESAEKFDRVIKRQSDMDNERRKPKGAGAFKSNKRFKRR